MQTLTELPHATLYYREGSSDKVYQCQIEQAGDRFVVNFAYGRRGSTMNTGTKTNVPVDLESAQRIFEKLVKEKRAKGYTEGESLAVAMESLAVAMVPEAVMVFLAVVMVLEAAMVFPEVGKVLVVEKVSLAVVMEPLEVLVALGQFGLGPSALDQFALAPMAAVAIFVGPLPLLLTGTLK